MKTKGNTANKTSKGVKKPPKAPEGTKTVDDSKTDIFKNASTEHVERIPGTTLPKKQHGCLSRKRIQVLKAINGGMAVDEAYFLVHGRYPDKKSKYMMKRQLEQKKLTDPSFVDAAQKALMNALKLKVVERTDKSGKAYAIVPTHTHALTAASMVMERAEPAVRQQLTVTATISPVDLEQFRFRPPDSHELALPAGNVVDVLPEPTQEEGDG